MYVYVSASLSVFWTWQNKITIPDEVIDPKIVSLASRTQMYYSNYMVGLSLILGRRKQLQSAIITEWKSASAIGRHVRWA